VVGSQTNEKTSSAPGAVPVSVPVPVPCMIRARLLQQSWIPKTLIRDSNTGQIVGFKNIYGTVFRLLKPFSLPLFLQYNREIISLDTMLSPSFAAVDETWNNFWSRGKGKEYWLALQSGSPSICGGIEGSTWNPVTNRCELAITVTLPGAPAPPEPGTQINTSPPPPLLSTALDDSQKAAPTPTPNSNPMTTARSHFNAKAGQDSIRFLTVERPKEDWKHVKFIGVWNSDGILGLVADNPENQPTANQGGRGRGRGRGRGLETRKGQKGRKGRETRKPHQHQRMAGASLKSLFVNKSEVSSLIQDALMVDWGELTIAERMFIVKIQERLRQEPRAESDSLGPVLLQPEDLMARVVYIEQHPDKQAQIVEFIQENAYQFEFEGQAKHLSPHLFIPNIQPFRDEAARQIRMYGWRPAIAMQQAVADTAAEEREEEEADTSEPSVSALEQGLESQSRSQKILQVRQLCVQQSTQLETDRKQLQQLHIQIRDVVAIRHDAKVSNPGNDDNTSPTLLRDWKIIAWDPNPTANINPSAEDLVFYDGKYYELITPSSFPPSSPLPSPPGTMWRQVDASTHAKEIQLRNDYAALWTQLVQLQSDVRICSSELQELLEESSELGEQTRGPNYSSEQPVPVDANPQIARLRAIRTEVFVKREAEKISINTLEYEQQMTQQIGNLQITALLINSQGRLVLGFLSNGRPILTQDGSNLSGAPVHLQFFHKSSESGAETWLVTWKDGKEDTAREYVNPRFVLATESFLFLEAAGVLDVARDAIETRRAIVSGTGATIENLFLPIVTSSELFWSKFQTDVLTPSQSSTSIVNDHCLDGKNQNPAFRPINGGICRRYCPDGLQAILDPTGRVFEGCGNGGGMMEEKVDQNPNVPTTEPSLFDLPPPNPIGGQAVRVDEKCAGPLSLGRLLATGEASARIYESCWRDMCGQYVTKIVALSNETEIAAFQREIDITKRMSDARISPHVVSSSICKVIPSGETLGILTMEKWDMTILQFSEEYHGAFKSNYKQIRTEFIKLVKRMHALHVHHHLLEVMHLMVKLDPACPGRIIGYAIVDYGHATVDNEESIDDDMNMLKDSLHGLMQFLGGNMKKREKKKKEKRQEKRKENSIGAYIPNFAGDSDDVVWHLAQRYLNIWREVQGVARHRTREKAVAINFRAAVDELSRRGYNKDKVLRSFR